MKKKKRAPSQSVDLLIANQSLIPTYGHDTASSFVNVLRDESLDPGSRRTKISERIVELETISTDLKSIILTAPSPQAVHDASSARDKITSLIELGKKVVAIDVATANTTVDETPTDKILVFEEPYSSEYSPSEASVYITDRQPDNHAKKKLYIALMTVFTIATSVYSLNSIFLRDNVYNSSVPSIITDYIPGILCWAVVTMVLGYALSKSAQSMLTSRPRTRIDRKQFEKFLWCYSRYYWHNFERALGFDFTKAPHMVDNPRLTQWFLDAHEIFTVVDAKEFEESKRGAKNGPKYNTKLQKALRQLGKDFDDIMSNSPAAVKKQVEEHDDMRKKALRTIKDEDLISEKNEHQCAVIDAYLTKTSPSAIH